MRIHIGADHAGFDLKQALIDHLSSAGHQVTDHGADHLDPQDDYPGFCFEVGLATAADPGSLGVVIGGSGNGEQIAANKVAGIRAALIWNTDTATLARQHNDANVASLGARQHPIGEAISLVDAFLAEPFSGDPRHERRIQQIAAYEAGSRPRQGRP